MPGAPARDLFLERPELLGALAAHLEAPGLVTLVGPPGVGKTVLARQLLATQTGAAYDLAWFVDLTDVDTRDQLLDRVAAALGVQQTGSLDVDPGARLLDQMSRLPPFVLVLDNFEQLVPVAARLVAAWTRGCAQGRFVVTSRQALRVLMERRLEVTPLSLEQAERLFVSRARAVAPDFALDDATRAALNALLECLDRLPLAVELAAARAALLSVEEMRRRLGERRLLSPPMRLDGDSRHRSLSDAIGWSWELLDEPERAAVAQLAVFRGGFTLEAAEAVVRLPRGGSNALAVLESLHDKSLLARHPDAAPDGRYRFTLYQSIRRFAEDALAACGELTSTRERHADYYIAAALRWRLQAVDAEPDPALRSLTQEANNLEAIHAWARQADPARNAMALLGLSEIVFMRGGFERHATALRQALETLSSPFLAEQLRAELGIALLLGGRPYEARAELESIVLDRPMLLLEVRWRLAMANTLRVLGEAEAGEAHLRECLERTRANGDRRLESVVLCFLGNHLWHLGRLDEAERLFEQTTRLNRAVLNPRNQARTLAYFGMLRMEQGSFGAAVAMLEEARSLHAERGEQAMVARTLLARALVAVWEEDLSAASDAAAEALALAHRTGEVWVEAVALALASMLAVVEGRLDDAATAREAAAPRAEALGDPLVIEAFACADWVLCAALGRAETNGRAGYATADWAKDSQGTHLPLRLVRALAPRVCHLAGLEAPVGPPPPTPCLVFGPEATWFRVPGRDPVSLKRRGPLRAILRALGEGHAADPQRSFSRDELQAIGWPGERMRPDSAAKRIHVAIWTLRRLGLRDVIETVDSAYRLVPRAELSTGSSMSAGG